MIQFFIYYTLFIDALCISTALYYLKKLLDMKHFKSEKTKKTDIKCPLDSSRILRDFEVFNGHCLSCPKSNRRACRSDIIDQQKREGNEQS